MNLTWEGLFKLGYKLEFWHPDGRRWKRVYELGGLWFVQNRKWRIRLVKGQV